jgi:putative SOS response-associated peptidase YedK
MCGRFVRVRTEETYGDFFGVPDVPRFFASYNVAPTQPVPVIRMDGGRKVCRLQRWGLIPPWAKDKKAPLINARGETVATSPAFRAAFRQRRCLVLTDGYYEWKTLGPKNKQPYLFRLKSNDPFVFAGIWEARLENGEALESCSIITTQANDLSRPIHDRMPVILRGADVEAWLDSGVDVKTLDSLLRPLAAEDMVAFPVSSRVNKVSANEPTLIEPLSL